MKNIWTIIKKELARVFKDPRLVLTIFILPGLMIFGIYMLMGDAMNSIDTEGTEKTAEVYVINKSDEFNAILNAKNDKGESIIVLNANYYDMTTDELEAKKELLEKSPDKVTYILEFEEGFDDKLAVTGSEFVAPKITTYYNPSDNLSTLVNDRIIAATSILQTTVLAEKLGGSPDVLITDVKLIYDEKKTSGQAFAMMFPFLIITFLFSGAMSVGPESIAGEKERGTIATLLITPTKRSHIALAKICSLSILALISAVSSFIGVLLSIPKLMGSADVDASIYGIKEYGGILLILVVTVFVIIGMVALVSAFAKNIKEAAMYISPLLLITMVVGISTMFSRTVPTNNLLYLIPVYNSVQVMAGIFSFDINFTHLFITVASNIVITGGLIYVLTMMFNSEKLMFAK